MPPLPHRVDRASAPDIPALVELLNELFTLEQDFHPDPQPQARGLALLLEHPDRAVVLVARSEDGHILGMVSAQLVISTAEGAPSAWIEDLIIQPRYRGQGLGRQLLQHALAWASAAGATRAQLLLDLDNRPAIGFYNTLGWQPTRMGARRLYL